MSENDASDDKDGEDKGRKKDKEKARYLFEDIRMEIDPDRIDEAFRSLTDQVRKLVDQGRYTKVRLKYKGKPMLPDIPLGVFVATEAVTFIYGGLLKAMVVNLGVKAIIEVEFIHDADERVAEGVALYMDGEIEAAEAKYREALRMKSDDPAALYNLGVLLRVTGRREEALKCFEKVVEVPNHPDAVRAAEALEKMKRGPRTL